MNKENDKEKVIDLAYKYIVEKMKYDLKSDEADHLKRIITPFVKDVTSLELFNFFPFEIMTPEMLAEFCAEHLIMRGAANLKDNDPYVNEDKSAAAKSKGKSTTANSKDKSTTDDNKNKNASDGSKDKITNLRQIMDNLRKGLYGSLIESGAVDSFIINKEELENFLPKDYDGTVPDYIDDCFIDYSNYFKDVVLLLGNRSSVSDFINCRRMIEDLKRKYLIFFKFDQFPLILFLVNEDDHIGVVNQQQRILKCMVDIVNYLILETMTLFIMDKNWYKLFRIKKNPEHINALLSKNELSLMSFKDYHSKIHGKVDI